MSIKILGVIMNETERNIKYNSYVEAKIAKTHAWPSLFNAFWVGGFICVLGQVCNDLILNFFPNISLKKMFL